jgi:small-conductance mechanosensitive channel
MKRAYLLLFLAGLGFAACAAADGTAAAPLTPAPAPPTTTSTASNASPLTVFNREIFRFRAPLAGVSAADRASRAQARIHDLLDRPGPNQVSQVAESMGVLVQIDGATAFAITPADMAADQSETLDSVAQVAAAALVTVVAESKESRDIDSMLHATGKALAAATLLWALVRVAAWLRRKVASGFANLTQRHAERVQLGGLKPLQSERVVTLGRMLLTGLHRLFLFIVFYNWLSYTLSCFPYTRVWGDTLSGFLLNLLAQIGGSILRAVPGLFTALLIFFVARWFNGLLTAFFERVRSGQVQLDWLDADVVAPTRRIAKTLVWLFALAMAYPYLPGAETEAFKGLSVLAGLMISLGASNLVGQAASGLILTYGRVFRKGEYVRVADSEGTVTEMGMFATRIRTGLGEELTIANSKILESTTKNYSRVVKGAGFVLDTTVTIGYDTAWRQVHAMLIEAALRTDGVQAEPPPVVFQTALSDWYPEYRLVCQAIPAEPRPRALVLSALHAHIQDVFNEYGVQIMSPQYFEDPPNPKVVPPEQWYPAPATRPPGK